MPIEGLGWLRLLLGRTFLLGRRTDACDGDMLCRCPCVVVCMWYGGTYDGIEEKGCCRRKVFRCLPYPTLTSLS